ncbi:uncharacterized protein LOC120416589 [Culex pipiens pallens]|uniref:uncharacterized protein LOC120416589 n=1 Tax=Culex pipiens pallens TaxID=42434 RepID=UPI0019542F68|nr:uncharacterized protein LOC120416589 [Culex pipiens pallens]
MLSLKITVGFFLIASLACQAKFTNSQKRILHSHFAECAADLGIRNFTGLEVLAFSGRQTTPELNFCTLHRMDLISCDGTVHEENFFAFIADGHNNMEQLPAVLKGCVDVVNGTPVERAFQLYRCMFAQHKFEV